MRSTLEILVSRVVFAHCAGSQWVTVTPSSEGRIHVEGGGDQILNPDGWVEDDEILVWRGPSATWEAALVAALTTR